MSLDNLIIIVQTVKFIPNNNILNCMHKQELKYIVF